MDNVTDLNFLVFAAKCYDSVTEDDTEFMEDLSRIVYIKRLLNKYIRTGELKERLILNHLIILHNVFGQQSVRMLFLKIPEYYPELKTFLDYLSLMPSTISGVNGQVINTGNIPIDYTIAQRLAQL